MRSRLSSLIPFSLITIFSIVAVEGAYQTLEYFVLSRPFTEKKVQEPPQKKIRQQKNLQAKKPDYRIILQRNLFGSPAKPSVPRAVGKVEKTVKDAKELGLVLMGTISGSDNNNRAIILTKQNREQALFSTGDAIQGAQIKEIRRGKIVLSINGQDKTLDMSEAAKMRPVYKAPRIPVNNVPRPAITERGVPADPNMTPSMKRPAIRKSPAASAIPQRPIQ